MDITLVIPELLWPEPEARDAYPTPAETPALARLLARADWQREAPLSEEACLLALAAADPARPAPLAPLRLLGEAPATGAPAPAPGDARWWCADPVHLRFHQDRLILAAGPELQLDPAAATQLAASLNEHFAATGNFVVLSPERWYLRLAADSPLQALPADDVPPLSAVTGRRLARQLPEDAAHAPLRRLLNEAQMLLFNHPHNAEREAAGLLPINSLWLWGPGSLPANTGAGHPPDFDHFWGAPPLLRGLAQWQGQRALPLPASATALLGAPAASRHLVWLDELAAPVQQEDAPRHRQLLAGLDQAWLAPVLSAARQGQVRLQLIAPTAFGLLRCKPSRSGLWHFWKSPCAAQTRAQALASSE